MFTDLTRAQQQLRWATVTTIDMGQKQGAAVALSWGGELGPRLKQCGLRAWAEVYFRSKWHLHPSSRLATIDMSRKLGDVHL